MAVFNGCHTDVACIKDDNIANLVYEDGVLLSGPLDSFIQHLVPTAHYYPDRSYIFAFLLSSRLFLLPHQLLHQVCETCILQQNLTSERVSAEILGKFGPHMIRLLGEWSDNFPYDFRDERMLKCLKDMTQLIVNIYPDLRRDVSILMHNLFSKLASLHKYEDLLSRINAEVTHRLVNIMPSTDICDVCPTALILAQQLTHIELERLSMIGPEEFVQAFAKEKNVDTMSPDVWKTNNIDSYVQWFNRLSYLVATEICMHLKKRNRVRVMDYFVDVAKECINIGNFNSTMAIIVGLNMSSIQRLKKTWLKVNKEKFEILEHQTNPSNNFSSYRSSLKAALWRSEGASADHERIVVPFFSLLVKDIYYLNEGCVNRLPNGHVNFEKFWQLAKQITDFMSWKQIECPFERHPPVLNYLLTNPIFNENSLALASFECEPPDNSFEKQHLKQLKDEVGS